MQYVALLIILFSFLQARSCGCTQTDPAKISLMSAIKKGNVRSVVACLADGADPNIPDQYGNTPLHWAVYCKKNKVYPNKEHDPDASIVKLLLDKGAAIDTKDKDGWTAFDWANYRNNNLAMKHLINKAVDLGYTKIRFHNGKTLLHVAVILADKDSTEIVKRLLLVLDPNITDNHGNTPLYYAVLNTQIDIEVIKMLLAAGAFTYLKNNSDGTNILDYVDHTRKDVLVQLLLHSKD